MKLSDGLLFLFGFCERESIRLELEYETGRYLPGNLLRFDRLNDNLQEHVVQGPSGWRLHINMDYAVDDDQNEKLFPTLDAAVRFGIGYIQSTYKDKLK